MSRMTHFPRPISGASPAAFLVYTWHLQAYDVVTSAVTQIFNPLAGHVQPRFAAAFEGYELLINTDVDIWIKQEWEVLCPLVPHIPESKKLVLCVERDG